MIADAPLKVAPLAEPVPLLLNVTELATDPADPSIATPVNDCDALLRLSAMAVVPMYRVLLPRTPEGIVPVSCPAGMLVKPEPEPLNEVEVNAPVDGLYCSFVEETYSVVIAPVVWFANSGYRVPFVVVSSVMLTDAAGVVHVGADEPLEVSTCPEVPVVVNKVVPAPLWYGT